MRGLLWRLISTRLPFHLCSSMGTRLGAAFLLNLTPPTFPAVLTHFSVDVVKNIGDYLSFNDTNIRSERARSKSAKVDVLQRCCLETEVECLAVCLSACLCLQAGAFPPQGQVLWGKGFILVKKRKKGTILSLSDIYGRGLAAALERFGKTLRKSRSWRHNLGFKGFLLFIELQVTEVWSRWAVNAP